MIYLFLKRVVKWSFLILFRRKVISGENNIPSSGPLIIAVNHPNTLIDPLLVASQIKRKVGFLANASIFINKLIKSIFNYFWVIPVYRKKDVKPGEKQDNSKSFQKCYEFFDKEGALLIFPEGTSVHELKLRDIKKGTAWIALGYESERNFEGNLQINTVAINYSDPIQFRSMASVVINPPFKVSDYKVLWEEDQELAVQKLTDRIRYEMEGQITITENKEQEETVLLAQKFYAEYIDPSLSRYADPLRSFDLRKRLAEKVLAIQEEDPEFFEENANALRRYFFDLSSLKLSPGFLRARFLNKNKAWIIFLYIIELFFLFPFYLIGIITNYLPYKIPDWLFRLIKPEIEYRASILMLAGMIVFPVFYMIDVILFREFISNELIWTLFFIISLPFLGFITLFYWKIINRFFRLLHFYFRIKTREKNCLLEQQSKLISLFKKLKLM